MTNREAVFHQIPRCPAGAPPFGCRGSKSWPTCSGKPDKVSIRPLSTRSTLAQRERCANRYVLSGPFKRACRTLLADGRGWKPRAPEGGHPTKCKNAAFTGDARSSTVCYGSGRHRKPSEKRHGTDCYHSQPLGVSLGGRHCTLTPRPVETPGSRSPNRQSPTLARLLIAIL